MASLLYRRVPEDYQPANNSSLQCIDGVDCEVGRFKATQVPLKLSTGWYASVADFNTAASDTLQPDEVEEPAPKPTKAKKSKAGV